MSVNIYNSSTGELTPLAGIPYETLNSKANKTVISPSSTAETSATASKSHTENDYFELNGLMVQALDDINIGDTLTEGINYRVTDISTELEIINTNIDNKADKDNLTNISVSGTTNTTESTITSGTFFYKSGILVRAKADIAVNATLTENTNYEVVTAGGLNKLTNDVLDVASVASSAASTASTASSVASRADDMIWKSTDQYSTSKAYSVGDYVIYNNTLYKCTTACSAGSWSTNSSKFTSTTLSTAVTELNSALFIGSTSNYLHQEVVRQSLYKLKADPYTYTIPSDGLYLIIKTGSGTSGSWATIDINGILCSTMPNTRENQLLYLKQGTIIKYYASEADGESFIIIYKET